MARPLSFALLMISLIAALILLPSQERSHAAGEAKPSVYLLVLDELTVNIMMTNQGQLNRQRFPHFAALADEAVWYRNHTASADNTPAGVSAILTGIQPNQAKKVGSYQSSLFSLLGPSHEITAMDNVVRFCVRPGCNGISHAQKSSVANKLVVDTKMPSLLNNLEPGSRSSANFQARQLAWMINSISASQKPQLWFAHVALPHVPWSYLENGDQYLHMGLRYPGVNSDGRWSKEPAIPLLAEQRTLLQLQFIDLLLGQWIDKLKSEGQWDKSLVMVTADHGASNRPGLYRRPITVGNFADIAHVPLLVKYPSQAKGRISDRATRATEIMPTIARVTKTQPRYPLRGGLLTLAPERRNPLVKSMRLHRYTTIDWAELERHRSQSISYQNRRLPQVSPMVTDILANVDTNQISEKEALGASIRLDNPGYYQSVVAGSGWRPAVFTTAHLTGVKPRQHILVTVNDTPAAVGAAFQLEGKMRFAALVNGLTGSNNNLNFYLRRDGRWLPLPQVK